MSLLRPENFDEVVGQERAIKIINIKDVITISSAYNSYMDHQGLERLQQQDLH